MLPAVVLDVSPRQTVPAGIQPGIVYLVMGEVAWMVSERGAEPTLQPMGGLILLDVARGAIVPGVFQKELFRVAEEDELPT